jgi:hypothetical protein
MLKQKRPVGLMVEIGVVIVVQVIKVMVAHNIKSAEGKFFGTFN